MAGLRLPGAGDRRRLVLLGGGALAAVLFAATRLLAAGGDEPAAQVSPEPLSQAGRVAPPAGGSPTTPETPPAAPALRDPFCPLVVASTPEAPVASAGSCVAQTVSGSSSTMKLLEVFKEEGQLHARVQVGPKPHVLHLNEAAGEFKLVRFADPCADFTSAGETRSLCVGEEWGATPG